MCTESLVSVGRKTESERGKGGRKEGPKCSLTGRWSCYDSFLQQNEVHCSKATTKQNKKKWAETSH
jgi:hypothetical protein